MQNSGSIAGLLFLRNSLMISFKVKTTKKLSAILIMEYLMEFQKIMVPIDGPENSLRALDYLELMYSRDRNI